LDNVSKYPFIWTTGIFNKSSAVAEKKRHASVRLFMQHCYGTDRFIIFNTDESERQFGERSF